MNLSRIRELHAAWCAGAIRAGELSELRDALPEVIEAAALKILRENLMAAARFKNKMAAEKMRADEMQIDRAMIRAVIAGRQDGVSVVCRDPTISFSVLPWRWFRA